MYQNTWIIVANGSKARFFRAVSNKELEEFDGLFHPESRLKGEDLISDRPGRTFDIQGKGRHSVANPEEDLREAEFREFSRKVAKQMEDLAKKHPIEHLHIAATPKFMGMLLKDLNHNLQSLLREKIHHDLTVKKTDEIREYLPYVL